MCTPRMGTARCASAASSPLSLFPPDAGARAPRARGAVKLTIFIFLGLGDFGIFVAAGEPPPGVSLWVWGDGQKNAAPPPDASSYKSLCLTALGVWFSPSMRGIERVGGGPRRPPAWRLTTKGHAPSDMGQTQVEPSGVHSPSIRIMSIETHKKMYPSPAAH
eukprot:scaffold24591_cov25-Tisochrysis_lutea.AAC.1